MYISKLSQAVSVSFSPAPSRAESAGQNRHYIQRIGHRRQPGLTPLSHNPSIDRSGDNHSRWNTTANTRCRVLQVEDNAENRFIVHSYLKREYAYESVEQGEHALAMLGEQHFDVIVMDINLGAGINGIETARRIRAQQQNEHTAIIAVTANVSPQIKRECLQAGMDMFLPKPFRKEDLMQAMDSVLQAKLNRA